MQTKTPQEIESIPPVRLTAANLARLFGVSRAAVSKWVKTAIVPAFPDGTIDPNAAVAGLMAKYGPAICRSRVLSELRAETEETLNRLTAAEAARDVATKRAAALLEGLRLLTTEWADAGCLVEDYRRRLVAAAESGEHLGPAEIDVIFDLACDYSWNLPITQQINGMDDETIALVRTLDPTGPLKTIPAPGPSNAAPDDATATDGKTAEIIAELGFTPAEWAIIERDIKALE